MKKAWICLCIISTFIIVGLLYTLVPKTIKKEYSGYIFSQKHTFIKKIPITLKGKQFNRIGRTAYFIGSINVDNEVLNIESSSIHTDIDNSKYFYITSKKEITPVSQGISKVTTALIISKDYTIVFGYTPKLRQQYGDNSYFKTQKDLKTFFEKY